MSHDQKTILCLKELSERMCLYTRLYTRCLFELLGFSAEIEDLSAILYYSLIPAAPKGHIDSDPGILIILRIGITVHTDTDTQRHSHLISDINCLYFLQQAEALRLKTRHVTLLDGKEVFILFQLFDDSVDAGDIFVDLPVDQGN